MSEERPVIVKEDIQEHYIIYDREIKPNPQSELGKNILVTNDNLSNRLYFNMFYTFDDRELENKEISIVWINANDEKGFSVATDKTLEGDRLSFAWNVPVQATYKEGIVYFAVRIVSDNYIWNSLAGKVEVKKGLVTESFNSLEDAELSPGWVDYIEGKYQLSLVKISETDYTALSPKDINTIYVVEMNDGSVNQYLGDKQISGSAGTLEGDYLTVGFSDSYDTRSYQYGFVNRDESLYTIFQHNTDDTLTVLKDDISATELEQYTFSDDLTYYIFDKTPIPFKTGYVTSLQWTAKYTINSCTVQTIQNYIYSYDNTSFNADSITLDAIKSPSDGINIGSGNINGTMVSSTGEIVIGDSPLKEYDYKYVFIGCSVKRTTTLGSYTVGRANLTQFPNVNGPNVMYYQRGSSLYYAGEPYKLPIDEDSMSYTGDGKLKANIIKYLPVNTIMTAPVNYVTGVNNIINISSGVQFIYAAKGLTGINSTSTAQQTTVTGLKSGDYYIGYAPNAAANKKIRYNITDLYIGIDTPATPTDDSVIFWYNPSKITNTLISKDSSEVFQGILLAKYTYNADTDKISNCTPLGKRDIDGSFLTEYINTKKSDNDNNTTVEYPGITAVPENNIWLSIPNENSTTYTIHAGLSVKLPYGKNADGTNKFIDSTFTEDKTINFTGPYGKRYIVALPGQSSMATINEIVISTTKPVSNDLTSPSANFIYWYNSLTNNSYLITTNAEEVSPIPAIIIGWLSCTSDSTGAGYYIRDIHQLDTFTTAPMSTSLSTEINDNDTLIKTPSDVIQVTDGETTKYYVGGLNNYVLNTKDDSQNFISGNENVVIGHTNKIQANDISSTNNFIVGHTNNIINKNTSNSCTQNNIFGSMNNITDSYENMIQGNQNTLIDSNKSFVTGVENSGTYVYESFINGLDNNVQNLHSTIISGNGVKTIDTPETSRTTKHLDNSIVIGNSHEISGGKESIAVFGQYNKAFGDSTFASFIAGQSNTDYGSRSTITGFNNTNLSTGDYPVQMFGQSGVNRGHNSAYFGFENVETETASSSVCNMYIGSNNTNTGTSNHSLIGGQSNTIESALQSIIHGINNTVSATTSSSIITGSNNQTSNVYNSVVFGDNNHVNNISGALINGTNNNITDFNFGIVAGNYLTVPSGTKPNVQILLGQYNIPDTENKYCLVIGNGTANDSRGNSLTLSTDGNLEVIGDIKLKTINSLSDTISQLLTKVNELTTQVSELTARVEALETPTPTPTPTE